MQETDWEVAANRCSVQEKIGSGCTATVYRGTLDGQEVAIKQIDWDKKLLGEKQRSAFDREVAIMKKTSHPNLVAFKGVCSECIPFRIITEYCRGGCCFELLHNCQHIELEWPQQLKMAKDVALAMEYLHGFVPQIVHRDLKSLNLLLVDVVSHSTDIPIVKVSDFGLSRMKDHTSNGPNESWGKLTMAAGTIHWMAPEVVKGTSYDETVDVYSFSMILFEVITREIPFDEMDPAQVTLETVNGKRPDMEAIPPDCPSPLQDLMVCCWDQDPQQRPNFVMINRILDHVMAPKG